MFNFTVKQLRYVEAAGRLSSIAKAAEELNISQSSITAAINAMEARLGHDLFIRTPAKGIQCTPAGVDALKLVRTFLDHSLEFEAEILSGSNDTAGTVRLACYATAAPAFLPPIISSFTADFPSISLKLLEGNMRTILEYLSNGEADIAFTYSDTVDERFDFVPLFEAPPYALLPAMDPLAQKSVVTFEELASRQMVLLDLPATRDYFVGLFESRNLKLNIVHSTRSSEIARALVGAGFGFTILNIRPPDSDVSSRSFKAIPLKDPGRTPTFGIISNAGSRVPAIVRVFMERCTQLRDQGAFADLVIRTN